MSSLPGPVVDAVRAVVSLDPGTPVLSDAVAAVEGPAGRHVREAWRSGDRDLGRVTWLVARHVGAFSEPEAWAAVVRADQMYPGRIDPRFLAQARQQDAGPVSIYGANGANGEEKDPERFTPIILGAVALTLVGMIIRPPWE